MITTDFESLSSEDQARVETVHELSIGILRLSEEMLALHGEDKQASTMLMAALASVINEIDAVSPNFSKHFVTLLQETQMLMNTKRKYDA